MPFLFFLILQLQNEPINVQESVLLLQNEIYTDPATKKAVNCVSDNMDGALSTYVYGYERLINLHQRLLNGPNIVLGPMESKTIIRLNNQIEYCDREILDEIRFLAPYITGVSDKEVRHLTLLPAAVMDGDRIGRILKHVKRTGLRRFAIIYPEDEWGDKIYRLSLGKQSENRVSLIQNFSYDPDDIESQIGKFDSILKTANAANIHSFIFVSYDASPVELFIHRTDEFNNENYIVPYGLQLFLISDYQLNCSPSPQAIIYGITEVRAEHLNETEETIAKYHDAAVLLEHLIQNFDSATERNEILSDFFNASYSGMDGNLSEQLQTNKMRNLANMNLGDNGEIELTMFEYYWPENSNETRKRGIQNTISKKQKFFFRIERFLKTFPTLYLNFLIIIILALTMITLQVGGATFARLLDIFRSYSFWMIFTVYLFASFLVYVIGIQRNEFRPDDFLVPIFVGLGAPFLLTKMFGFISNAHNPFFPYYQRFIEGIEEQMERLYTNIKLEVIDQNVINRIVENNSLQELHVACINLVLKLTGTNLRRRLLKRLSNSVSEAESVADIHPGLDLEGKQEIIKEVLAEYYFQVLFYLSKNKNSFKSSLRASKLKGISMES